MWMGTKDKLTKTKCNEGSMTSSGRSFWESPNLVRKFCVPTAEPLSPLCLLGRKMDDWRINVAKNGKQQLIGHILSGHSDLTVGKEEGIVGTTPPADHMVKVEQITIIVQTLWRDDGLQNADPLKFLHETRVRKISIHPFLPTQWCTQPEFEENRNG